MTTRKEKTEVWDAMGRGTPAGRALFAIYNGDRYGRLRRVELCRKASCHHGLQVHGPLSAARASMTAHDLRVATVESVLTPPFCCLFSVPRSSGKRAGNHFSTLNREILGPNSSKRIPDNLPAWGGRSAEDLSKARANKSAKSKVAIPRVGKGRGAIGYGSMRACYGGSSGGRRDATMIKEELRTIEESIRNDAAQPRAGPVMDELEKERLAFHMTFRSNPPAEIKDMLERKAKGDTSAMGRLASSSKGRGSAQASGRGAESTSDEAERLFQEVLMEVKEREDFLEKMTELGRRHLYEQNLKVEIGTRLAHLKKLDRIIERERANPSD